jgi:hypothetical protein
MKIIKITELFWEITEQMVVSVFALNKHLVIGLIDPKLLQWSYSYQKQSY